MSRQKRYALIAVAALLFLVLVWMNPPGNPRQWLWVAWLSISIVVVGYSQEKLFVCAPNRLFVLWGLAVLVAIVTSIYFGNFVTALIVGCGYLLLAYLVVGHVSNSPYHFRQYGWIVNITISILLLFFTPDVNRITLKLKEVAVPTHFSWQKEVTDSRSRLLCTVKYYVNFSINEETFTLCAPGGRTDKNDIFIRVAVNRESGINILSLSYGAGIGMSTFRLQRLRKTDLHIIEAALPHQRSLIDRRPVRVLVLPIKSDDPVWLKIPRLEVVRPTIPLLLTALFVWQLVCLGFLKLCPLYGRSIVGKQIDRT